MTTSPAGAAAQPTPDQLLYPAADDDLSVYPNATLIQRWYAITLDLTLAKPLNDLLHIPFEHRVQQLSAYGQPMRSMVVDDLVTAVPFLLCLVIPTLLWGQSLGKKIVGIRVIQMHGKGPLTVKEALLREVIGKPLSVLTFGLSLVMALTSANVRSLHDQLGGTRVITYREPPR